MLSCRKVASHEDESSARRRLLSVQQSVTCIVFNEIWSNAKGEQ